MNKAGVFDRDGTLIKDTGFLCDPEDVELLDGVKDTLIEMKNRGYLIGVVTNQSGIGRGMYNESDCIRVCQKMEELLGFELDALEICPHRPQDGCRCRKPSPYMIHKALEDMNCDLPEAFFAGDKRSDVEAGRNAGVKTVWCDFGKPGEDASDIAEITISQFSEILDYL